MNRSQHSAARLFLMNPSTLRGMTFMLISALFTSLTHLMIRHVSADIHAFEISFFRCLFGLMFMLPLLVPYGLAALRTQHLGLHAMRSGLNVIGMWLVFAALAFTPLAKVAALDFSSPLFASALAFLFLGERLRARRLAALATGFFGTWVIFRPGVAELDVGAALVVLASAMWGGVVAMIKVLARTESTITITLYLGLFMTPMALIPALFVWQTPSLEQLGWLLLVGAFGTLNQLFVAQALKEADVTAVMPMDFTRLIWSAIFGYMFYAEISDVWTWLGAVLIFSSTTYIAFRERALRSAAEHAASGSSKPASTA